MLRTLRSHVPLTSTFIVIAALAVILAACGGSTASNAGSASMGAPQFTQHMPNQNSNGNSTSSSTSMPANQQYLIKSLNISLEVKDTQKAAQDLQNWITTTDSLAVADGINYQQVGGNLYNVSLSFSVQASLFPRIESYLDSYAALNNGKLLNSTLNTQDVSNDYVDSQSRLTNLKSEQQRLLTLMSQAQSLNDTLTIDQRLTDVEGQIEQIEAHLNDLKGQTSFYTIAISLQPIGTPAPAPQPAAWSSLAVWQGATSAFVAVWQVLLSMIIWLLVFSVYIVPLAVIAFFVRRWQRMRAQRAMPKIVANTMPPTTTS